MTDSEDHVDLGEGSVEDIVQRMVEHLIRDGDVALAFGLAMHGEAALTELLAELYPPKSDRREPTED
jgi:hypothetical protein